jgi:hypothetical protein
MRSVDTSCSSNDSGLAKISAKVKRPRQPFGFEDESTIRMSSSESDSDSESDCDSHFDSDSDSDSSESDAAGGAPSSSEDEDSDDDGDRIAFATRADAQSMDSSLFGTNQLTGNEHRSPPHSQLAPSQKRTQSQRAATPAALSSMTPPPKAYRRMSSPGARTMSPSLPPLSAASPPLTVAKSSPPSSRSRRTDLVEIDGDDERDADDGLQSASARAGRTVCIALDAENAQPSISNDRECRNRCHDDGGDGVADADDDADDAFDMLCDAIDIDGDDGGESNSGVSAAMTASSTTAAAACVLCCVCGRDLSALSTERERSAHVNRCIDSLGSSSSSSSLSTRASKSPSRSAIAHHPQPRLSSSSSLAATASSSATSGELLACASCGRSLAAFAFARRVTHVKQCHAAAAAAAVIGGGGAAKAAAGIAATDFDEVSASFIHDILTVHAVFVQGSEWHLMKLFHS